MYVLHKAPQLRYVFIEHNVKVNLIHIEKCALVSVPRTIRNAPRLLCLIIRSCRIKHLDLNDLVQLPALRDLDLNHNQIVSIVELPAGVVLPINRLYLTHNKIRHVDRNVLHALKELHCLVLDNNRIEEFPPDLALPVVEELSIRHNKLATLNCTSWQMPYMRYLFCNNNRLTSVPIEWQTMWRMDMLDLSFNRLHSFRMDDIYLTQLRDLNLAANELASVTTAQRHLRVPLERLQLAHNRLTVLDISRWGMPNLWELDVDHNQLTELGDAFMRFPAMDQMMILRYNNWSCAWLKRVHPDDLVRRNYGCLATNQSCPEGRLMVQENAWICCW
ncbi:malignant fibrous histiocytoma-amplified sequence 1 homolog [Anopheles stephensi]|uniref:malignant fibrous histiocytoma-amplified sequence 1 homolog n=1 Tax=Anopheles stephensi TaxID=30069 RepID=UPI00165889DE|nr:malignant fibrous histiocytoma-amplified sequence 1 homolog [Anopheles stephensi]